jgi:hypothetical protein
MFVFFGLVTNISKKCVVKEAHQVPTFTVLSKEHETMLFKSS